MFDYVRIELWRLGRAIPKMIALLVIGAPFALISLGLPARWAVAGVVFWLSALAFLIESHVIDTEHELSDIRGALSDLERQISALAIDADRGRAALEAELSRLREAVDRQ